MDNSRFDVFSGTRAFASVEYDEFLAAILGRSDPANSDAFAAGILREYNFNPDEPRDERGRWTTGGSGTSGTSGGSTVSQDGLPNSGRYGIRRTFPGTHIIAATPKRPAPEPSAGTSPAAKPPIGTKENGYDGLGRWGDFKTEEDYLAFLRDLLKTAENKFPDGWEKVARRGCIGLNMLRIGWGDLSGPPYTPLAYPDAEYYASRGAAEARLRQLQGSRTGKEWLFVAAQMPLRVPSQGLVKKFGENKVGLSTVIQNVSNAHASDYNFATWFPGPGGSGYWEFMNHASVEFDPENAPCVYHRSDLPKTLAGTKAENVITLYGVVSRRPWKK
jgi:hypothetical protein